MKKFNWITTLILNVVTCGIYSLYMWYTMAKNSNKMAEQLGKDTIMGFIGAYLLGMITGGIYTIYWTYKFFKLNVEIAEAKGVEVKPVNNPILLLLIFCVPVYSYYVLCELYNNNVDAVA